MPLDPEDPDVRVAVLGKLVEDFLKSDIGDYLIKQSDYKVNHAVKELKSVSPWRRNRIKHLQNEIRIGEDFQNWLAEAYAAGKQAMNNLEGKDE